MRDAPHPGDGPTTGARVRLVPVDAATGGVAALTVAPERRQPVCGPSTEEEAWWGSCWLGGIIIDAPGTKGAGSEVRRHRRSRPLGRPSDRRWVRPLVRARQPSGRGPLPRRGFVETGEQVDGELVARLCR